MLCAAKLIVDQRLGYRDGEYKIDFEKMIGAYLGIVRYVLCENHASTSLIDSDIDLDRLK